MRHVVNFGLLFASAALAVSGALLFLQPFSIVVARVHILVAIATVVLIGMHLATRLPYFRVRAGKRRPWRLPADIVGALVAVAVLIVVAARGCRPAELIVAQGYEARHRAEIARTDPLSGFEWGGDASLTVARKPSGDADLRVSLLLKLKQGSAPPPTIAVWAETTTGSMIETLYLDPRVAYSDNPDWHGERVERAAVLPIWRGRYSLASGVLPGGDTDAVSGATPKHSFTLDDYLVSTKDGTIVLCVEVNAPGDPNDAFPDPRLGQPSLLYTAYIETGSEQPYTLLELTGRGSGTGDRAVYYDLEKITSAKRLIDLLLAKVSLASE